MKISNNFFSMSAVNYINSAMMDFVYLVNEGNTAIPKVSFTNQAVHSTYDCLCNCDMI